jgi:DNA-binding CsgD family transcriptional regulator
LLAQIKVEKREWLLNQLAFYCAAHKSHSDHQVWQEGSHPQEIDTHEMVDQKLDYIHNNPVLRGLVVAPPLTRTLQQLMPVEDFVNAEVGAEWRACGIYPRVLSFHPLADGTYSALAIYRECSKPVLTPRQAKIAHVILSGVPWLHVAQGASGERTTQVPQLPVRERLVLELLLQGYSRKAIAATMGISINTVAGYAKNIYRFFNVASQAGLSQLFRLT